MQNHGFHLFQAVLFEASASHPHLCSAEVVTSRKCSGSNQLGNPVVQPELRHGAKHSPLGGDLGDLGGPLGIWAPRCFGDTQSDFSHRKNCQDQE